MNFAEKVALQSPYPYDRVLDVATLGEETGFTAEQVAELVSVLGPERAYDLIAAARC
jgi:alkylhydroperoxidase family enzyme